MNIYIADTKYAAENLIRIMQAENRHLQDALTSYQIMKEAERDLFENMKQHDTFTPEGIIDLFGYHDAAERFEKDSQIVVAHLSNIDYSRCFLAGSLLQIAKQGISTVHGSLSACPPGRSIGGESLKNVVWQGRNQAMHHEETRYHSSVVQCFTNLELDFGIEYKLGSANLAYKIVVLLAWTSYDNYEADMNILLP